MGLVAMVRKRAFLAFGLRKELGGPFSTCFGSGLPCEATWEMLDRRGRFEIWRLSEGLRQIEQGLEVMRRGLI